MRKLSLLWVPLLLTIDQKRERVDISRSYLEQNERNEKDSLRRFITVDETWIHHYTPETINNYSGLERTNHFKEGESKSVSW